MNEQDFKQFRRDFWMRCVMTQKLEKRTLMRRHEADV